MTRGRRSRQVKTTVSVAYAADNGTSYADAAVSARLRDKSPLPGGGESSLNAVLPGNPLEGTGSRSVSEARVKPSGFPVRFTCNR